MVIKRGTTRVTFLVGKYAIKTPNYRNWRLFLKGILANIQEHEFGRCGFSKLAPVLWISWGGFIVIMPRVEVKSGSAGKRCLRRWLINLSTLDYGERMMYHNIVEQKVDSVGYYKGKIVAVDYGS